MNKKIKDMEARLKKLESWKSEHTMKRRKRLEGTESPIVNSLATLAVGWLALLVCILAALYRYFRMVFFMSREEQHLRKKSYIDGKFNFVDYICGEIEEYK